MKIVHSKIICFGGIIIALFYCGPSFAQDLVGRWCDEMIPNMPEYDYVITMKKNDASEFVIKQEFADGSVREKVLHQTSGSVLVEPGSGTGDKFQIDEKTGDLKLMDNLGLIRTATRLPDKPSAGECRK